MSSSCPSRRCENQLTSTHSSTPSTSRQQTCKRSLRAPQMANHVRFPTNLFKRISLTRSRRKPHHNRHTPPPPHKPSHPHPLLPLYPNVPHNLPDRNIPPRHPHLPPPIISILTSPPHTPQISSYYTLHAPFSPSRLSTKISEG